MTEKERQEKSYTVAYKGDLRIEILENSDYLPYGGPTVSKVPGERGTPGTHHITFIVGGPGVERLYSAQVHPDIADGPIPDLVDFLIAGINTSDVRFLKRFNVVSQ